MTDKTLIAFLSILLIVIGINYFLVKAKATETKARPYDYGIVKKGDTLFIYKDNKPIGCDIGRDHCIGDILRIEGKGDN